MRKMLVGAGLALCIFTAPARAQSDAIALQARALALKVLSQLPAVQLQAQAANTAATSANTQAQAAVSIASAKVTSVNGQTGAVSLTIPAAPDLTPYVKTFNGVAPTNGALIIPTTTFVTGFTPASPGTWANLNSLSACNAARLGNYAVVSDLYSGAASTNEVARCTNSGTSYYWRPQRTDYAANITTTGGTLTLGCGVSAPTAFVAGTLATNLTVTAVTTNCWPGATFQIANNLNLGLYGVTLGGLLGSATKTLGANVRMTIVFDGSNFQAF